MALFEFIFGLVMVVGILVALLVGGTFLTLVVRGSRWLVGSSPRALPGQKICANRDCRQLNPSYARFCRRCGRSI